MSELKITGRLAEVGNLDGGDTLGASIYAGDGRYVEVRNLTEVEARAIAPAFGEIVTICIDVDRPAASGDVQPDPAIGTPEGLRNYAKGYAAGRKKGRQEAASAERDPVVGLSDEQINRIAGCNGLYRAMTPDEQTCKSMVKRFVTDILAAANGEQK